MALRIENYSDPIPVEPVVIYKTWVSEVIDKIVAFVLQIFNYIASCFCYTSQPLPPLDETRVTLPPQLPQPKIIRVSGSILIGGQKAKVVGEVCYLEFEGRVAIDIRGFLRGGSSQMPINGQFIISKNDFNPGEMLRLVMQGTREEAPAKLSRELPYVEHLETPILDLKSPPKRKAIDPEVFRLLSEQKIFAHEATLAEVTQSVTMGREALSLQKEATRYEKLGSQLNLLTYIHSARPIDDKSFISFERGRILEKKDQEARGALAHLLKMTYGVELADRVCARYDLLLTSKGPLTMREFKEILVGISASVTMSDLARLFYDLRRGVGLIRAGDYINPCDKDLLLLAPDFRSLKSGQLEILLNAYRTLPINGHQEPTLDALFSSANEYQVGPAHFKKDADFLRKCTLLGNLDESQMVFSVTEQLAKEFAYSELEDGAIVPMLDRNGNPQFYEVVKKLPNYHDGVVGHLLRPSHVNTQWSVSNPCPLELNFRGTQPSSEKTNSGRSVECDLDVWGVGYSAFERRKPHMIQLLIEQLKDPSITAFELNINGHSLGGAFTQRMLTLIVAELAKPGHDPVLDKIVKISATAHNPPGVELSLNTEFQRNIAILAEVKPQVKVDLTYVLYNTDPVQVAGAVYVGAQTRSQNFTRRVMFLGSEQVKFIAAHGAKGFEAMKEIFRKQVIDETEPDELEKILGKWALWDSRVGRFFYNVGATLAFPLQGAVWWAIKGAINLHHRRLRKEGVPEIELIEG